MHRSSVLSWRSVIHACTPLFVEGSSVGRALPIPMQPACLFLMHALHQLRFQRDCAGKEAYQSLTASAKQEFRKRWAADLWTQLEAVRSKEEKETRRKECGEAGKFLTKEKIVQKLGGGAKAEEGAERYIQHCWSDPQGFVRENAFTGMHEFLFVQGIKTSMQGQEQSISTRQARLQRHDTCCLLSVLQRMDAGVGTDMRSRESCMSGALYTVNWQAMFRCPLDRLCFSVTLKICMPTKCVSSTLYAVPLAGVV